MLVCVLVSAYNIVEYFKWTHTDDAIRNRDPYIITDEFYIWLEAQYEWMEKNRGVFNLEQWKKRLRDQYLKKFEEQIQNVPSAEDGGLTLRAYSNNDWKGEPFTLVNQAPFGIPAEIKRGNFSLRWTGKINIQNAGKYRFGIRSDDGAHLFIDGEEVVDNGGHHALQTMEGRINLKKGWHDIEVLYFQDDGARDFKIWWTPPGRATQAIPPGALKPEESVEES